MALFPASGGQSASSCPSVLAVVGVVVLVPLTLAGWGLACAALWLCDRVWLPRPSPPPPPPCVPDVDTLTEYGWAHPPAPRR